MAQEEYGDELGELAVVFGDFHIPMRVMEVSQQFKNLLTPNQVQHVFCTGNIGNRQTLDWIKSLSSNVHIVKGQLEQGNEFPDSKSVTIGNHQFGLIHGHQVIPWGEDQALNNQFKELDAQILISGHTHQNRVSKYEKKYLINPGSITGAYSPLQQDPTPTFILLEIQEKVIDVYLYSLNQDKVEIQKTSLSKIK